MALSAAKLQVEVGYADKGADAGLRKLDRKVDQSAQKMSRDLSHGADTAGAALKGLGVVAIGTGAALGGAFAIVSGNAAEFGKTMSGVQAVSGATGEEMKALSALALQLGKDTSFTATESGKAIEDLLKGGVGAEDILAGAARATLDLATAGGVAPAQAAEHMADAMNIFGLTGEQASRAANLIAGAANASSQDVNDFNLALKQVGAVARISGQDFDSTATAISVMAQAGIKGSDAGTSLKTMLLNLQPTTKAATAMFQELGILTADGANKFVDAQGKFKSMGEIAEILRTHTMHLTEAQRLQALETMFGTDAIRAASIMATAGAAGFETMAGAMGKVTAEAVGLARLDNLSGDVEKLKGSFETASIMIGSMFDPVLRSATQALTGMLNAGIESLGGLQAHIDALVANEGLSQWDATLFAISDQLRATFGPETAALFEAFTVRVGEVGAMIGNFFAMASTEGPGWVEAISGAMNQAGAAIDSFFENLGNVIIGVALFGKAIGEGFSNFGSVIREHFDALVVFIQGFFTGLDVIFADQISAWQQIGAALVEGIKAGIGAAFSGLGTWFSDRLVDLLRVGQDAIRARSPSEESAELIGEPIGEGVALGIERSLPEANRALTGFMESLVSSAGTFAVQFGKTGGDLASDLALAIANNTPQAGAAVGRALQKMVEELGKANIPEWQELGNELAGALHEAMATGDTSGAHALIEQSVGLIQAAKDAAQAEKDAAKAATEAEREAVRAAKERKPGEGFFNAVTEVSRSDALVAQMGAVGAQAAEAFGAAWEGDRNAEAKAGNAIQRMIGEAQRLGIQDANSMGGAIIDALGMALKTGDTALRDIGLEALAAFGARTEEVKTQVAATKTAIEQMVTEGVAKMKAAQDVEGAKEDAERARVKLEQDFMAKQAAIRSKGGPNMGADLAAASAAFAASKTELDQRLAQQEADRQRKARNDAALAAEKARLQGIGAASLAAVAGGAVLPPGVTAQSLQARTAAAGVSPEALAGEGGPQAPLTKQDFVDWALNERPIELSLFLDGAEIEAVVTRRHADNTRTLATA